MFVVMHNRTGMFWCSAMHKWVEDINLATQCTTEAGLRLPSATRRARKHMSITRV